MKKLLILTLISLPFIPGNLFAQVKMGNNPTTIGASSVLEIESTNRGVLFPRMTGAQMNAIASPVSGMYIYNTDSLCLCQYNGTAWRNMCGTGIGAPDPDWHITGNSGTTASTAAIGSTVNNNFIGTRDSRDFVFATNNLERMRIASGGNVGLGVLAPTEALSLNGDALKRIAMERNTVANTAGNTFVLRAGGATTGATDRNGGTLFFASGVSTGTGSSTIGFVTAAGGLPGTADNALTQKMIIMGDGKVGMGLTNPYTNLNVRGATAAPPNTSGSVSNAILRLDAQNNALDMGAYTASPYGSWIQSTTVGNLATNQVLAINPNGGYVGIGTAAPANRLEIVNNAGGFGADDDIAIKSYGNTLNPDIILQTAAGTQASPTNLSNGSELGSMTWWGQANGTASMLSKIRSTYTGSGTTAFSDFRVTTSGIEHFRMDSIGRIMQAINATTYTPKTSYHMQGDGTGGFALQGTSNQPNPNEGPEIGFSRGGFTQGVGAAIQFIDYDAYSGGLAFLVHKGTRNGANGAFADNWPLDVIQAMTIENNGKIGIGTGDPNSLLEVNGSFALTQRTVNATTTLTAADAVVYVANGGTAVTITLPTPVGIAGRIIRVGRTTSSTGAVTVNPGAGTIEALNGTMGATTTLANIGLIGAKVLFQSNGTNWLRFGNN